MSESATAQSLPPGKIIAARNVIHKVPELLDTGKRFRTENLPGKWDGKSQSILRKLTTTGVLIKKERYEAGRGQTRVVFEWNMKAKEELQEYLESMDTLPCGHRVHIKNNRDGTFGCKYCDDKQNYPESLIRELMDDD